GGMIQAEADTGISRTTATARPSRNLLASGDSVQQKDLLREFGTYIAIQSLSVPRSANFYRWSNTNARTRCDCHWGIRRWGRSIGATSVALAERPAGGGVRGSSCSAAGREHSAADPEPFGAPSGDPSR